MNENEASKWPEYFIVKPKDMGMHHFKTAEMLDALGLTVGTRGVLWSTKNGAVVQRLCWSAEEAIAYVVGRMLELEVREEISRNAVEH